MTPQLIYQSTDQQVRGMMTKSMNCVNTHERNLLTLPERFVLSYATDDWGINHVTSLLGDDRTIFSVCFFCTFIILLKHHVVLQWIYNPATSCICLAFELIKSKPIQITCCRCSAEISTLNRMHVIDHTWTKLFKVTHSRFLNVFVSVAAAESFVHISC